MSTRTSLFSPLYSYLNGVDIALLKVKDYLSYVEPHDDVKRRNQVTLIGIAIQFLRYDVKPQGNNDVI